MPGDEERRPVEDFWRAEGSLRAATGSNCFDSVANIYTDVAGASGRTALGARRKRDAR